MDGRSKFTLHKTLEGLRDRRYFKWMKSPHDILHCNKCILLHGLLYIGLGLSKKGVRNAKLESGNLLNGHWLLEIFYCHVRNLIMDM